MQDLLGWFFTTQPAVLILQPDESGKKYAGFHSGEPLKLSATMGETVATVMERFNAYRGPDEQINRLFTKNGTSLLFTQKITGTMIAIVKHD